MENASKALIIAGAILLAILIIALGMRIFGNANLDVNMDPQKARAFNAEFEGHFGKKRSGSDARALYDAVAAHNRTAEDESLKITVKLPTATTGAGVDTGSKPTTNYSGDKLLKGKVYDITGSNYDSKSGYLTEITIANAS